MDKLPKQTDVQLAQRIAACEQTNQAQDANGAKLQASVNGLQNLSATVKQAGT